MKKILVAAAVALFASQAMATIKDSSHDLSAGSLLNRYAGSQISSCQFCHAPHNSNTTMTGAPLWNRADYLAYSGTLYTSSTFTGPEVLGTASLVCLSCHDGTTDMGGTYTGSKGFLVQTPMNQNFSGGGVVAVGSAASNGISDDHPVGIAYPANGIGTSYQAIDDARTAGAKFYGATNQVECGSCHDPHGTAVAGGGSNGLTGGGSFLRIDATGICGACHNK